MKTLHLHALALLFCFLAVGCQRRTIAAATITVPVEIKPTPVHIEKVKPPTIERLRGREVYAVWYDVPEGSLARRRGGFGELTAAHNHLPIGTLVCVTNIQSGKSVLVRITDRGITHRKAKIDLCKEAAQQLGIVRQGIARVRLEVLPSAPAVAATDPGRALAH